MYCNDDIFMKLLIKRKSYKVQKITIFEKKSKSDMLTQISLNFLV